MTYQQYMDAIDLGLILSMRMSLQSIHADSTDGVVTYDDWRVIQRILDQWEAAYKARSPIANAGTPHGTIYSYDVGAVYPPGLLDKKS